ncbi:glycerol-3-phosphate dehydrogenase/oxidase [Adhaeribacter sp. BT258]|uniref:Glycerol-3-phosphate dehydrogenase n=1 Tax=Adhaeribacter terrigena TaxID=2793070 RepID=A0ABS1C017_9BACT|nr:glycerol-3-phosphate dehydrogenase/oxidase [Adhaeribacter terrigena]MBK0402762.1 glycerol-3-phosphate dehydrogenase/oxidase [Adhaeribacter terrigena]
MNAPAGISTLDRVKIFSEITIKTFDILVIGGGIMGAGIALDAASRGLRVLLVEKQDFAAGTSSRSTKLIHGGLRYLKNFELGLVRTVARERKVLNRNAPHLVMPEPMLIPILKNASYGYWATKAGLTLYDLLGNVETPERHRMLDKTQTLAQEPLLNPEKLQGAGCFVEYRTDDGRLTMEVLKTAHTFGATCLNYCELRHFTYNEEKRITGAALQDKLTGKNYQIKATCVINATGPWSAKIMQQDQPEKLPELVHTKGVHLVVPFEKFPLKQAVYFDIPGGRMLFAIPRQGVTYFGTTDTPFTGNLEKPRVEKEDVAYLLAEVNKMFTGLDLKPGDVISSWAGVRVLLYEAGKKPSEISRKDEIFISASGLITVAGGKLTGYRKLAEQVVNKALEKYFPENRQPSGTAKIKLSGGDFENAAAVKGFLKSCQEIGQLHKYPSESLAYLVRNYGTNTKAVLKEACRLKAENLDPETRLLQAEICYTIQNEGVTSLSDFLIRRTGKLYFERGQIIAILPAVKAAFQKILTLGNGILANQESEFMEQFEAAVAFKNESKNAMVSA